MSWSSRPGSRTQVWTSKVSCNLAFLTRTATTATLCAYVALHKEFQLAADNSDGYEYMGFYPNGSPKYDNNFCKDSFDETEQKKDVARSLPVPSSDLVHGEHGPLVEIWGEIDKTYKVRVN